MKVKFKGRVIKIKVRKLSKVEMIKGLMFTKREKARALLFDFNKSHKMKIHSLFVFFPFLAVWLDKENKVIELKVVKPWSPFVMPKKSFYRLIEIPMNKKYKRIIKFFLDGKEKDLNTISA